MSPQSRGIRLTDEPRTTAAHSVSRLKCDTRTTIRALLWHNLTRLHVKTTAVCQADFFLLLHLLLSVQLDLGTLNDDRLCCDALSLNSSICVCD